MIVLVSVYWNKDRYYYTSLMKKVVNGMINNRWNIPWKGLTNNQYPNRIYTWGIVYVRFRSIRRIISSWEGGSTSNSLSLCYNSIWNINNTFIKPHSNRNDFAWIGKNHCLLLFNLNSYIIPWWIHHHTPIIIIVHFMMMILMTSTEPISEDSIHFNGCFIIKHHPYMKPTKEGECETETKRDNTTSKEKSIWITIGKSTVCNEQESKNWWLRKRRKILWRWRKYQDIQSKHRKEREWSTSYFDNQYNYRTKDNDDPYWLHTSMLKKKDI